MALWPNLGPIHTIIITSALSTRIGSQCVAFAFEQSWSFLCQHVNSFCVRYFHLAFFKIMSFLITTFIVIMSCFVGIIAMICFRKSVYQAWCSRGCCTNMFVINLLFTEYIVLCENIFKTPSIPNQVRDLNFWEKCHLPPCQYFFPVFLFLDKLIEFVCRGLVEYCKSLKLAKSNFNSFLYFMGLSINMFFHGRVKKYL